MATLSVLKFNDPGGADRDHRPRGPARAADDHPGGRCCGPLARGRQEAQDPPPQHVAGSGATWGAFWGFLFGLIFFVPFLGAAIGPAWVG